MTTAAGSPLLHVCHFYMRIFMVGLEDAVMAVNTGKHAEMLAVTEDQRTKIRDADRNRINRVATGATVQLRSLGIVLVVTGAAGLALCHLCHRYRRVFCTYNMKNGIMTGRTVIVQVLEMVFMFEGDFPGILGRNIERLLKVCAACRR